MTGCRVDRPEVDVLTILILGVFVGGVVVGALFAGAFLLSFAPRGEYGQIEPRP